MFKINCLSQLIGATVVVGMCFHSTAAHALKITLGTSQTLTINDNSSRDLLPDTTNKIRFNQTVGGFSMRGTLIAQQGGVIDDTGSTINGILLNLTSLTITNRNTIDASTRIVFDNEFPFSANSGAFAFPFLDGQFINSPNSPNRSTFVVRIDTTILEELSSIGNTSPNQPYIFEDFLRDSDGNARGEFIPSVNDPLVRGTLNFRLRAGQSVSLPDSACTVIVENSYETNFTFEDSQRNCDLSALDIPEPSSMISMLALGALGTGSLLKRKQKSGSGT
ncbi:MAG TPA: hypothetical protein DCL61_02435 [Cyanobacteria bacterium UBA12227]|nr:hypothetical protein [Cyanobacteria bacterium UBA12227]HAX90181.1 hypothetical protein [Cyanobacteria bacterium UBA11370]HBY80371.1 hypothetical protein [Cyanobacteria bacterium UBA11148]